MSTYSDNRAAEILLMLRHKSDLTAAAIARELDVSDRTIRNDIRQLNENLEEAAVIESEHGHYRLRILNADKYQKAFEKISGSGGMFGTSNGRQDYIFGELMRSDKPLLTDELAYEMNVGRSTLISDLKKLREKIEAFDLSIVGMTSKGMVLHGSEIFIRTYILENCFDALYKDYPLDEEIGMMVQEFLRQNIYEKQVSNQFSRYLLLALDRFLTGHYIGELSGAYYNLTSNGEFYNVNRLFDQIGGFLHIDFPVEEKLFAFLPIAGMHNPTEPGPAPKIELDAEIQPLIEKIMLQIYEDIHISIDPRDFAEEFAYHLMYMLNRLRFRVHTNSPLQDEMTQKFPLAHVMSGVACRVIERETGLVVTPGERAYLTAYFGIFLEENNLGKRRPFRIAVVCGTGLVSSRLISVQLRKILDSQAQIQTFSDVTATRENLEDFDVVLTTIDLPVKLPRPVIRIREIFDERILRHKLEKIRYWDQVDIPMLDDNQFIMSSLLDEDKVFFFDKGCSYEDALGEMIDIFTDEGQLDDAFAVRLAEREEKGSMVFDNGVAIPHSIQYATDHILLAMGILEETAVYKGRPVSIIFFMAFPEKTTVDDMLIIRVYDELLEISRDVKMLEAIAGARSYSELLRVIYKSK